MALIRSALGHMKQLINLSITDLSGDCIDLPHIVDSICNFGKDVHLKTLDISGISKAGNSLDWANLRARRGTASFTELTLHSFLQTPEALEALLMWPAKLHKFTLDMAFRWDYSFNGLYDQWGLDTLHPLLSIQKSTLSAIRIRGLNRRGLGGINLSDFQALQELSLSHDLTGTDSTLIAGLVAPKLRVFRWDMTLEDQQHTEFLDSFGIAEEDWLREFAKAAIGQKSNLKEIFIQFKPETWCWSFAQTKYPWDRMDGVAQCIRPHGVQLSYTTPTISRERFLELVEQQS